MDEETLKRINSFLNEQGQSIKSIPKNRLQQLEKTDKAIQERLLQIAKAKDILNTCKINVSVIAEDSGISRKTFYNNDLLRLFVEKYSHEPEESASLSELQRLKEKNQQFKLQVDAFLIRDIETENLRHENMKLATEISHLQTLNQNLEKQHSNLIKEMQNLRQSLAKAEQTAKIIQLPSKK